MRIMIKELNKSVSHQPSKDKGKLTEAEIERWAERFLNFCLNLSVFCIVYVVFFIVNLIFVSRNLVFVSSFWFFVDALGRVHYN